MPSMGASLAAAMSISSTSSASISASASRGQDCCVRRKRCGWNTIRTRRPVCRAACTAAATFVALCA